MTHSPDRSPGPAPARGAASVALAIGASFLARAVAGGSVESLRAELWLTDQALGTLGSAFAGAYAAALPAGALVARSGRRTRLLAAGLALCGLATAASALAHGFFWLAFGRSAAGLGAGLVAGAAASLLARPEPRARSGSPGLVAAASGVALGYLAGGLCGRAPGWRLAFVLAGAALVGTAALHLSAAEPAGGGADPWAALRQGGLRSALRRLGGDRVRALGLAAAILGAAGLSALGFWLPALLVRLQTTPSGVAGGELAATVLAAALAGAALARAGLRASPSERAPRWIAAAGAVVAAFGLVAALTWRAPVPVLAAIMVALLGACTATASALAAITGRDAPEPAALALAVLLVHGVGEVAGPIAVGAFADRASFGEALTLLPWALLGSAVLWAASAWAGEVRARAARTAPVTAREAPPATRAAGTRRDAGT